MLSWCPSLACLDGRQVICVSQLGLVRQVIRFSELGPRESKDLQHHVPQRDNGGPLLSLCLLTQSLHTTLFYVHSMRTSDSGAPAPPIVLPLFVFRAWPHHEAHLFHFTLGSYRSLVCSPVSLPKLCSLDLKPAR